MSKLDQPPPSFGISEPFLSPTPWKTFVRIVLDITVQAYQNMREKVSVQQCWEEDHFTLNMEEFISPLAYRHPMNLTVLARTRTHTAGMRAGKVSAKQAKEIDIRLWGRWENYRDVYFAWEGKRIAPKDIEKYKDLVPEYIKEGIFRFVDAEYSSRLDDAGMLGYVLMGDIPVIVGDINRSMVSTRRLRRLNLSDHLKLDSSVIGNSGNIYLSCHKRLTDNSPIMLHHLFLTFDFANGT